MFGRVRASYCSPDSLERLPSKILKDDSLSIYVPFASHGRRGKQWYEMVNASLGSGTSGRKKIVSFAELGQKEGMKLRRMISIHFWCRDHVLVKKLKHLIHDHTLERPFLCLVELQLPSSTLIIDPQATLVRLKLGSQRDLSLTLKDAEDVETSSEISSSCPESKKIEAYFTSRSISEDSQECMTKDLMGIDSDCSSISDYPGNLESTDSSKLPNRKNGTVLYLFSKFKSSQHSSSCVEAIAAGDEHYVTGF